MNIIIGDLLEKRDTIYRYATFLAPISGTFKLEIEMELKLGSACSGEINIDINREHHHLSLHTPFYGNEIVHFEQLLELGAGELVKCYVSFKSEVDVPLAIITNSCLCHLQNAQTTDSYL